MLERLLTKLRAHPFDIILTTAAYFGVVFSLMSGTPTDPPTSDFAYYMDMANGLYVPDPFGKRILMPFIVGLLGANIYVFHYINLILVTFSAVLLYMSNGKNKQSFISALLYLGCTRAITMYAGEPSPDGMTYFLIASTIFLVGKNYDWLNIVVFVLAAANHPISFVIVVAVFVISNYESPIKLLYLIPGAIVFLFLLPSSYGYIYFPDLPRLLNVVKSVNVLWLGILTIRKDKESFLLLSIILSCLGFSLVASNIDRILSPLGLFLAPRFVSLLYPPEQDQTIDSENPNNG